MLPVLTAMLNYYPHLQALSASSPFWGGEDTGYASNRALMFQQLPTAGLPFQFDSWAGLRGLRRRTCHHRRDRRSSTRSAGTCARRRASARSRCGSATAPRNLTEVARARGADPLPGRATSPPCWTPASTLPDDAAVARPGEQVARRPATAWTRSSSSTPAGNEQLVTDTCASAPDRARAGRATPRLHRRAGRRREDHRCAAPGTSGSARSPDATAATWAPVVQALVKRCARVRTPSSRGSRNAGCRSPASYLHATSAGRGLRRRRS